MAEEPAEISTQKTTGGSQKSKQKNGYGVGENVFGSEKGQKSSEKKVGICVWLQSKI